VAAAEWTRSGTGIAAGLDEGLLSLSLSNLLYMDNPYSNKKKCQWRITAHPRISAQAGDWQRLETYYSAQPRRGSGPVEALGKVPAAVALPGRETRQWRHRESKAAPRRASSADPGRPGWVDRLYGRPRAANGVENLGLDPGMYAGLGTRMAQIRLSSAKIAPQHQGHHPSPPTSSFLPPERDDRDLEGKIHRVDPKFASRPSSLTENPYESLRVDPDSGSTL
jgi:hypothetical protein